MLLSSGKLPEDDSRHLYSDTVYSRLSAARFGTQRCLPDMMRRTLVPWAAPYRHSMNRLFLAALLSASLTGCNADVARTGDVTAAKIRPGCGGGTVYERLLAPQSFKLTGTVP